MVVEPVSRCMNSVDAESGRNLPPTKHRGEHVTIVIIIIVKKNTYIYIYLLYNILCFLLLTIIIGYTTILLFVCMCDDVYFPCATVV